jgi:hypothetical protein
MPLPSGGSGSGDGGLLPCRHGPGDALEMTGHDSPADPAAQAVLAVIAAAVELIAALQHADPTLDPGPEAKATPEPVLSLGAVPLRRHLANRQTLYARPVLTIHDQMLLAASMS